MNTNRVVALVFFLVAVVCTAAWAKNGNGVKCTFSSDCESGNCSFGKCASRGGGKALGNGIACTFSSDCASGNCSFGKCAARGGGKQLANGVACTFSSDCASGNCSFGVCKSR